MMLFYTLGTCWLLGLGLGRVGGKWEQGSNVEAVRLVRLLYLSG